MTQAHLTPRSANAKTGAIPVSTVSNSTCPDTCPFKGNGCYAEYGPLALHWRKVSDNTRGTDWDTYCQKIANLPSDQLWRHAQAGDLPGDGADINTVELVKLVNANKGKRGFSYTHYPPVGQNADLIQFANDNGFTVNLSANSLDHADELLDLGVGPVVTVLDSHIEGRQDIFTPNGVRVVVCPATYSDNISCATCKLCAVRDRNVVVGFPAHGSGKKKIDNVVQH